MRITQLFLKPISNAVQKQLERYSEFCPSSLSIQQYLDFGRTGNQKASYLFLRKELLVRLANIMQEINLLPSVLLLMPSTRLVRDWYQSSFSDLLKFEQRPPSIDIYHDFNDTINAVLSRHRNVVETMAEICDRGGGVPRHIVDMMFNYMYTTAPPPQRDGIQAPLVGFALSFVVNGLCNGFITVCLSEGTPLTPVSNCLGITYRCFGAFAHLQDEDRKLRQQAVVPPMLLDPRTRARLKYVNNNGLVREPLAEHQFRLDTFLTRWTEDEKRIFKEKLLQYGKNFAAIALFLDRKTTKDCVRYYYLTKKRENYKQLMRKQYRGRRGKFYKPPQMPRLDDTTLKDDRVEESAEEVSAKPEPEYFCIICKAKIDSASNPGRVFTRACYEQYGLDPQEANPQDVRICQKCRLGLIKKRYNHCPIGTCKTARRRVKPTRPLPPKWKELTNEQREQLSQQFQIGEDVSKCCNGCHKRISRKVEAVLNGEEIVEEEQPAVLQDESLSAWSEGENIAPVSQKQRNRDHTATVKPTAAKVPGIESEDEDNSDEEATGLAIIEDNSNSPKTVVKAEPPPETVTAESQSLSKPEDIKVEEKVEVKKESPVILDTNECQPKKEECAEIVENVSAAGSNLEKVSMQPVKIKVEVEKDVKVKVEDCSAGLVTGVAVSLNKELCGSQDSIKSSGESNATLSADEGHSEHEYGRKSPNKSAQISGDENFLNKSSTERASVEGSRAASALAPDSLPKLESRPVMATSHPLYKPKFRHLDVDEKASGVPAPVSEYEKKMSSVKDLILSSVSDHSTEEGLQARQQKKLGKTPPATVIKSESPDIEIIGQKTITTSQTVQIPVSSQQSTATKDHLPQQHRPPPKPQTSVSSVSQQHSGSITHGTPVTTVGGSRSAAPVGRYGLHQYEGLLRPATPFPYSREDMARSVPTDVSRISPLVFAGGMGESHHPGLLASSTSSPSLYAGTQAQALAQHQYRQALSMGLSEQQAAAVYQQALQNIIQHRHSHHLLQQPSRLLDDFRTSLQMPHLAGSNNGSTEQQVSQNAALLQQQLYGHQLREEQRRVVAEQQQRLAQERERIAQEQQRAIVLAQAAEHQQRAALLEHHLALAQVANQQYKEHLVSAAVAEHHQRALAQAEAQRRIMVGGSAPPTSTATLTPDISIKTEPKSPSTTKTSIGIGPSTTSETHRSHRSIVRGTVGTSSQKVHSVIQETKSDHVINKRSETPLITKGAMKEFPPSLQQQKLPTPSSVSTVQSDKQQKVIPTPTTTVQPSRDANSSATTRPQISGATTAAATASSDSVTRGKETSKDGNVTSIINALIMEHITPGSETPTSSDKAERDKDTPMAVASDGQKKTGDKKEVNSGERHGKEKREKASVMQRIESIISQDYKGKREQKGKEKFAYDFEPVSPISSPEAEISARESPASSSHSERPLSVHSSTGQSQTVYNVFSLPPTVLGTSTAGGSDPETTLAVQSITSSIDSVGGKESTGENGGSGGERQADSGYPDVDQEAAAAVMNLPSYEPLSDEES